MGASLRYAKAGKNSYRGFGMLRDFKGRKRYTPQDYQKLKRLWLEWGCDFTRKNIERLQKHFPERSVHSLAIHLFQVLPHRDKFNWQKFNNDHSAIKAIRLREQRKKTGKELTEAKKTLILKRYHYKCGFCGRSLDEKGIQVKVEFHHIIPLSLGGKDILANYEPVHFGCHKKLHHFGIKFVEGKMYLKIGKKCYKEVIL